MAVNFVCIVTVIMCLSFSQRLKMCVLAPSEILLNSEAFINCRFRYVISGNTNK